MGLKLIIDKVLRPPSSSILKNVDNVHISYKHNENIFIVNLSNKTRDIYDNIELLTKNNNVQISNSKSIKVNVDRGTFIKDVLENINKAPEEIGSPKKIVIDFSSPNIAKPFHAGHLRSTIIGNFIANINRYYKNKVTKLNYLGDWGTQFGLLQYGLQAKNLKIDDLKTNPIKTLYEVYVYANKLSTTNENIQREAKKYFSDIEKGNSDLENWKSIRQITIDELEKIYHRLGIEFDAYHWESDYNGRAIKHFMDTLEQNGIIKTDVTGKKVATANDRDVTVLKSDETTLYLSRDIAALVDRYKRYESDKMLYVVDNSQTDHLAAVFDIVKQISKEYTIGCEHIKFGRIKGMSTRTGNVVFLNDILDEAKHKMFDKQRSSRNTRSSAMNEETCDILGTTAVIINDLKQRRQKDYVFDWERALQTEGDSGIKLQYLHCRLWSLEQNSGISIPNICKPNYLSEEVVGEVVAELAKFKNVLQRSLDECEACIIVNYLFRLARHVNRMFNELNVKNVEPDLASQRLLVFHSARYVVKTSLEILGIKPLHEM